MEYSFKYLKRNIEIILVHEISNLNDANINNAINMNINSQLRILKSYNPILFSADIIYKT